MKNILKRLKNLLYIFIATGFIIGYINCQNVSAASLGDSGTATLGSYVTLGGKTWRVIGDNYLMLDQSDSNKTFGSGWIFNPSDSTM